MVVIVFVWVILLAAWVLVLKISVGLRTGLLILLMATRSLYISLLVNSKGAS